MNNIKIIKLNLFKKWKKEKKKKTGCVAAEQEG